MKTLSTLARAATAASLIALSTAAYAGQAEIARQRITAAQAKLDASTKLSTTGDAGVMQSQARAALVEAESDLHRGRKAEAIVAADHASELADNATVAANQRQVGAARAETRDAAASAAAAQTDAAAANARAAAAEQAAATANAQAEAARNQPPVVIQTPAPAPEPVATTTTVETEKQVTPSPAHTAAHRTTHRVVHHVVRKPATAVTEKTTMTVTTQPQ